MKNYALVGFILGIAVLTSFGFANRNQAYTVEVNPFGFAPRALKVRANNPAKITFASSNAAACARTLVFPSLGKQQTLPETGRVEVELPAQPAGTAIKYKCSMDMYRGEVKFE